MRICFTAANCIDIILMSWELQQHFWLLTCLKSPVQNQIYILDIFKPITFSKGSNKQRNRAVRCTFIRTIWVCLLCKRFLDLAVFLHNKPQTHSSITFQPIDIRPWFKNFLHLVYYFKPPLHILVEFYMKR